MKELLEKQPNFLPIYRQIAEFVRTAVIDGQYGYGAKLPPEPELAEQLNASRQTVRKALKLLEDQDIIRQQKGKGTFVVYRKKPDEKKKRVCIAGTSPGSRTDLYTYRSLLVKGIEDAFSQKNAEIFFVPEYDDPVELFNRRRLDGIMLVSPPRSKAKKLAALPLESIPHVILGGSFDFFSEKPFSIIGVDNLSSAETAVEYLVQLGHRRILHVGGWFEKSDEWARVQGYKNALTKNKLMIDDSLIFETGPGSGTEVAADITRKVLADQAVAPTAVFAGGFAFALGAMKAIQELGLVIPRDISLMGFDDFEIAEYLSPPLTTVRQPIYEIGLKAGQMLYESMKYGQKKKRQIQYDAELIIRESCSPVAKRKLNH